MSSLDLQQLELIFYGLLGLIVVTLVGLAAYVFVANRRARRRLVRAHELESLEPRPALKVTGQIMSLVRQEQGGPLQVEIAGKRYHRMEEIEEKQLRRHVVEAAMELVRFTGALGGGALAPAALEETYRWREDVRQSNEGQLENIGSVLAKGDSGSGVSPAAPTRASDEVEERFLDLLASRSQASSTPERPNLARALQRRRTPKLPELDQPDSFVDEIDRIIQRRIQLIPALAQRDLHVRSSQDGGVCFVFDGQEYKELGELPNLTARQLVKDAIQEWDETT